MKTKPFLTPLLVLLGLVAAGISAFFLGRLFLNFEQAPTLGIPRLSPLELPPQTENGFTAELESYYADANRLTFVVRVNSEKKDYFLSNISLKEAHGGEINAGYGTGPVPGDPSALMIDFFPLYSLTGEHLNGELAFEITNPPGDWTHLADFQFDLDIPVHPALTFHPKQAVWANGLEILLDRVVITPSYAHAYLCYIEPMEGDWVISHDTTLTIDSQIAHLGDYALLFDKSLGDGSKGGEPGWTPPVDNGRCVKIGFMVGSEHPKSLTLTIPALEHSLPEAIPEEDLELAYLRLKEQGIDMEWHTVDHGAYPEFKRLPVGMSEEEANRKFIEALGYTHPGTWVFEIPLETEEESPTKFSTSSYGAPDALPAPSRIKPTLKVDGHIRSFDLRPDQTAIAFATSKGVVVYGFDHDDVRVLNEDENAFSVDWSSDGKKLAMGGILMNAVESGTAHLAVWDTASWKTVFELDSGQRVSVPFGALAWSPDSNLLAVPFSDRGLVVLNIKTGETVAEQKDYPFPPEDISWSPDGSRLLTTGELAFGFRRWKLDTNEHVRLYDSRAGSAALRLAWSPDGTRIASGHSVETVCIWTVSTNQCDGLIYAHENIVSSLAWSPDGSQLATGGGVIRIWDSRTGAMIKAFGLNDQSIYTKLAWLEPNRLISLETGYASDSLTLVRFWDLESGEILMEFEGQSASFGQ